MLYDYLTMSDTGTNTYQNLIYSINEKLKNTKNIKKNNERNKVNNIIIVLLIFDYIFFLYI